MIDDPCPRYHDLLQLVGIHGTDTLVSFYYMGLCINVPVPRFVILCGMEGELLDNNRVVLICKVLL